MKKSVLYVSFLLGSLFLFQSCDDDNTYQSEGPLMTQDITFYTFNTRTAEVIPADVNYTQYEGVIEVPSKVSFVTYEWQVTGIGDSAFYNCTKLISVVLPATIQYVNKDAFNNCSALTTIVCKSLNPPTIDPTAFKGCETDKITLYVALESVDAYKQNDVWKSLNVKAYAVEE